jgi:hypothetical protein
MGFSADIKMQVRIAAAGRCCLCREYKGRNIEVHHIIPEAEGGPDTFDNAIPLCFDDHAEVGHYNNLHPKGLKYSRKEIRLARDTWYELVKRNNIEMPVNQSEHLHFRHLVLRQYDTAQQILEGSIDKFPIPNSLFLKNDISTFIKFLFKKDPERAYQTQSTLYRYFKDKEEILSTYPDIKIVDKTDLDYAYFEMVRTPTRAELLSVKENLDPFILYLIYNNVDPAEFSLAVITENIGCGDGSESSSYVEHITFRPFWFSFIAITNVSALSVELNELSGLAHDNIKHLTKILDIKDDIQFKTQFPKVAIIPNQTVILPTGIIICPFDREEFEETMLLEDWLYNGEQSQYLYHYTKPRPSKKDYKYMGKFIRPNSLSYVTNSKSYKTDIHQLDLTNLYVFDKVWHIGSCPHLFYQTGSATLEYVRELLAHCQNIEGKDTIEIPPSIFRIIIAELEDEITHIKSIELNGSNLYQNQTLTKGQSIEIKVNPGDIITIVGFYVKELENVREEEKIIYRNLVVTDYLRKNVSANNYFRFL